MCESNRPLKKLLRSGGASFCVHVGVGAVDSWGIMTTTTMKTKTFTVVAFYGLCGRWEEDSFEVEAESGRAAEEVVASALRGLLSGVTDLRTVSV